jgi:hypothetical protein
MGSGFSEWVTRTRVGGPKNAVKRKWRLAQQIRGPEQTGDMPAAHRAHPEDLSADELDTVNSLRGAWISIDQDSLRS